MPGGNEFSEGKFLRSPNELGCWKLLHYANELYDATLMLVRNELCAKKLLYA